MNVEKEVQELVVEMKRLGTKNEEGQYVVTFGVMFDDTRCANIFEGIFSFWESVKWDYLYDCSVMSLRVESCFYIT